MRAVSDTVWSRPLLSAVCSLQHWQRLWVISPDRIWAGLLVSAVAVYRCSDAGRLQAETLLHSSLSSVYVWRSTSVFQSCGIMTFRSNKSGFDCWKRELDDLLIHIFIDQNPNEGAPDKPGTNAGQNRGSQSHLENLNVITRECKHVV